MGFNPTHIPPIPLGLRPMGDGGIPIGRPSAFGRWGIRDTAIPPRFLCREPRGDSANSLPRPFDPGSQSGIERGSPYFQYGDSKEANPPIPRPPPGGWGNRRRRRRVGVPPIPLRGYGGGRWGFGGGWGSGGHPPSRRDG